MKISNDTNLDLKKLVTTRLLVNANSGGGKSWAIRRLLEQSHGQIQHIVIDLEGEFVTLREKYDYLLVGHDGEVPVSIRTAELLARRLLELNVSTIIDLSELRHPERITFVKRFLDSLVNAPKDLWHPALVIVDEAHQFCPESSKSESASAVIDLMTRGRKRQFCGVLATQRISKLNKDAAAECNNYMIGRTGLDIDMKRASELLGFTSKEDMRGLRDLKAGEFYLFGPAFKHGGIEKTTVGGVNTTHEITHTGIKTPIATPKNIQKVLKDIVDLPKEAEDELRTVSDYKAKVRELKTKLTLSEKGTPKIDPQALEKSKEQGYRLGFTDAQKENKQVEQSLKNYEVKLQKIAKIVGTEAQVVSMSPAKIEVPIDFDKTVVRIKKNEQESTLRKGAMKMLNWLAGSYPNPLSKQRLATLSGFSVKGGTFNTYISELKRNGWIDANGDLICTDEGLQNAEPEEIPSGDELLQMWKSKFREGAGKILQTVYEVYPNEINKDEVGYSVGFEPSGGTFNTYISELRRNGLISISGNTLKISDEFFE